MVSEIFSEESIGEGPDHSVAKEDRMKVDNNNSSSSVPPSENESMEGLERSPCEGRRDTGNTAERMNSEGDRFLSILLSQDSNGSISCEDAADLLSHLTKLRQNEASWNKVGYEVVKATVKCAMDSKLAKMDAITSKRILTDGILPFVSAKSDTASSSFHGTFPENNNPENKESNLHNTQTQQAQRASAWITQLVKSIVVEDLLPTVLDSTETNDSPLDSNSVSTIALDILFPSYLARMDSDEALDGSADNDSEMFSDNSGARPKGSSSYTVDSILDALCSVPPQSSQQKTTPTSHSGQSAEPAYKLRPHATAAVLASLREFESIVPGRLSRRRIRRKVGKSLQKRQQFKTQLGSVGNDSSSFEYVDRSTYIMKVALHSLSLLSNIPDPDALPPLVYQLGLTPLGLLRGCSGVDSSGVKVTSGENEKQRGRRLRRLCLEGIATALEDDSTDYAGTSVEPTCIDGVVVQSSKETKDDNSAPPQIPSGADQYKEEAWRWARYNSLLHLGSVLRTDVEMSKSVLAMLSGEIISHDESRNYGASPPFRFQRLTPFKLAMGLSMASCVPRMRSLALGAVRDLVVEEETLRMRRGLDFNGNVFGTGHPWINCLVKSLEEVECKGGKSGQSNGASGGVSSRGQKHGLVSGRHVLSCLLLSAKFASSESGENGGGMGAGGGLLQSLISLGFFLIDCVKKDEIKHFQPMDIQTLFSPTLDISSIRRNDRLSLMATSAPHATASIGRFLLCYLFYQSAAASSHFLSSSLSSLGRGSCDGGTALCRSILRSSIDRFCGMAPNTLEHALLLPDLVQFSPSSLSIFLRNSSQGVDELDDMQKEDVIALALTSHHLPALIDTLSNVASSSLAPEVASSVIVPVIGSLLLRQVSSGSHHPGLAGYLWKKRDVEDHIDHAFLLLKKSLFSSDVEKRKSSSNILVTLLGCATIASSISGNSSRDGNAWGPVLDEMRGCLRRCLTQHQSLVRHEAYSSLISLLPASVPSSGSTQDTSCTTTPVPPGFVSPASRVSGGATTPLSRFCNAKTVPLSASGQMCLVQLVSDILMSQLERYVVAPKEDSLQREERRRRARNIGSQLSQMEESEDESSPQTILENCVPFRLEMCISTRQSRQIGTKLKGGKSKKALPIGQSLLLEALNRINEPFAYLVACCLAVSKLTADENCEFTKIVQLMRRRMAGCNVDQYLKWVKSSRQIFGITDNEERIKEMAICKLATLFCLVQTLDTLIVGWNEEDSLEVDDSDDEIVERLFNLRSESIHRASEIMSSFAYAPQKSRSSKSNDENSQPNKATKKSNKSRKNNVDMSSIVKTSEANQQTQTRNRILFEEALHSSPALPQDVLCKLLIYGTERTKSKQLSREISDGHESDSVASKLARSLPFRKFIISKCLSLLGGCSQVIKAGSRFCRLDALPNYTIAASLSLGPRLFSEFCKHCFDLDSTSLSPRANSELSLAQLSLRAFSFCARGMAVEAPHHNLSKSKRVNALFQSSIKTASSLVASSRDGWNFYQSSDIEVVDVGDALPEDELVLRKTLLPFISLKSQDSDKEGSNRICLLSELLKSSMNGEAMECCQLITVAARAFSDPNIRANIGIALLRCFEDVKGDAMGVLNVAHCEENSTDSTLSCVFSSTVRSAFILNDFLDGETIIPIGFLQFGRKKNGEENLRNARSRVGLPTPSIEHWPESHHDRLEYDLQSIGYPTVVAGVVQQVAWAITAALDVGPNFRETFKKNTFSRKNIQLSIIKVASRSSDSTFSNELCSITNLIALSIESSLENAEFVLRLLPHMSEQSIEVAQGFVSCILLSVSNVINACAPSAENVDSNGTFAGTLLMKTKRLYGVIAKFISSYLMNPQSLASKENKCFLDNMISTLMPRVNSLLLSIQEKQETSGGKYLAESKIQRHGKTSALLVFEKEKLDNALLKVGARLKIAGYDGTWLEEHVVPYLNRDFVIKRDDIDEAKEREAPRKKAAGTKRKIKREPTAKKIKKEKHSDSVDNEDQSNRGDSDNSASDIDEMSRSSEIDCSDEDGSEEELEAEESEGEDCQDLSSEDNDSESDSD